MDPKLERTVLISQMEREYNCPIWETKDGELIPITQLSHEHLVNAHQAMCEAAWNARSESYFFRMFKRASKLNEEMKKRSFPHDHTPFDRLLSMNVDDIINANREEYSGSNWDTYHPHDGREEH